MQVTTFRVVPVENFRKENKVWKGSPVSRLEYTVFQTEVPVPLLQTHLSDQFQVFATVFR